MDTKTPYDSEATLLQQKLIDVNPITHAHVTCWSCQSCSKSPHLPRASLFFILLVDDGQETHTMTKPPSKASSPAITIPAPARSSIAGLIPILDAFNHRNKNQHRLSHWWSHFNILRRSLRPFQDGSATITLAHAIWMRDHVVPRSYL